MERSILVERKVRAHPVVLGRVIRQQMTEVLFPQHHDMVEASVPTDSGHSVRVLLDPAARLELGARWVNS